MINKFLNLLKRIGPTAVIFAGLILLAALGYSVIEDADLLRSLYWAVVTGFTVGFGDVLPSGGAGMLLCIFYIPAASVTYLVLAAHIVGVVLDDRNKFTHEEQHEILCEVQALVEHFKVQVDYSEAGAK